MTSLCIIRKISRFALAAGVASLLVSCTSQKHYVDATLDAKHKSISLPTGRSGMTGTLKSELRKRGWVIVTSDQRVVLHKSDRSIYQNGNSRYTLRYTRVYRDLSLDFQPLIDFSAIILDNETGQEVITYEADYTREGTCVRDLMRLIDENTR